MIHSTAIVSSKAKIAEDVDIGPFAIIDDDVEIGSGTKIGPKAHIINGARIGKNNYIGEGSLISDAPQDLKYSGTATQAVIGDNNVIREYVTVHRATGEGNKTVIGNNNFLMTGSHVAHECTVGSNVIIVNNSALAGHVTVDDYAFISGLCAVHQNCRIGAHSILGGGNMVSLDLPPFIISTSVEQGTFGINKIGLKRRGFARERIAVLEDLYQIYFRSKITSKEAIAKLTEKYPGNDDVNYFVSFILKSKRGVLR